MLDLSVPKLSEMPPGRDTLAEVAVAYVHVVLAVPVISPDAVTVRFTLPFCSVLPVMV